MAHNIIDDNGEKFSTTWSAGTGAFVRCPYPNCTHTGLLITKAHCRLEHQMEREEIGKLYGMPRVFESKGFISSQQSSKTWYNTGGGYLI